MKNILTAISLCVAACAPVKPLPAWYGAGNAEHPRFPRQRYITGIGLSSVSAQDADERAQANVSAQIWAQLQSETSSFQQYTSKTGDTAESVTSRVSVRSSFDRADLIRIVERETQGTTFYSFAALDRAATDRELAAGCSADLTAFKAAAQNATTARQHAETGVFATAVAESQRFRSRLDSTFIIRRAVMGHPAPEEVEYVAIRKDLLDLIEEARSRRVVGVVVKNPGNGRLVDFAVNAIKRLGLPPNTHECKQQEHPEDATMLEVDPEESCSEGSLGERCEVVVHMIAQACAGGTSGAGTVAMVRGVHPSDRDKARKSAWDKVTPQAIEAAVRDALKSAIQIGE